MLAVPLLAAAKLPSAKVRKAVTKAIHAGDANILADVFTKYGLHVDSVLLLGGHTVLHEAVVIGSPEIVEYLITNGAQVNVADKYGHTPLDEATEFGTAEVVALLEQAGATHGEGFHIKAAPTATGYNPTDTGDNPPQPQEVNNSWVDSFLYAARTGNTEAVELELLDHDADINVQDRDGMTALLYAASEGHTEIVELLLDRDADIEARNRYGDTALMYAIREGDIEIVKLLLDRDADIEVKDNDGRTALLLAVMLGENIETVKLLLDRDADIEAKDRNGNTALIRATFITDDIKIVKLLLDRGAQTLRIKTVED